MPIYAYRCASCGHAKDLLQRLSDPLLTVCPACGAATFEKQVTAAGFQLKGSGWYVTDFRGDNKAKSGQAEPGSAEPAKTDTAKPAKTATDSAAPAVAAAAPVAADKSKPAAAAPAAAAGSGGK
jgi:putative FmdB family regulatory protein